MHNKSLTADSLITKSIFKMNLEKQLIQKYSEILNNPEYQTLIKSIANDHKNSKGKGFSDILLGSVPDHYESAKNKILIVGRETRGWKLDATNPIECYTDEIIQKSMNKSKSWVNDNLTGNLANGAKGTTFFNFIRKVSNKCGVNGILWANTFSVDYKKSIPNRSSLFQDIKNLSKELLQAQIDILKPDYILFIGGKSSVSARREYFPNLNGDGKSFDDIPIKYLEKFTFAEQENPICYRTYHPAYRGKNAQKGLEKLIEILPNQ